MKSYQRYVVVAVVVSGLALSVIMPILAPLTRELGLADRHGGAIVSFGSIIMALTAALWGRLSDARGRKAGILAGFIGLAIGYALFTTIVIFGLRGLIAGTGLFLALALARGFTGAFLPAVPVSAQALIADNTTSSERSAGMALMGLAQGVGMVVGPAIGGILAGVNLVLPLYFTIGLAAIGAFWIGLRMENSPPMARPAERARLSVRKNGLWSWLLNGFCAFAAIITIQMTAGYLVQDRLNIAGSEAARVLSIAFCVVGVMLIFAQAVQMKVLKWSPLRLGVTGGPLFALGIICLLHSSAPLMFYGAYALMGVGAGMLTTGVSSGASLAVGPEDQGRIGGLVGAAQGIAAIVAPFGSTVLYELDPRLPFLLLLVALAIALLSLLAARQPKPA